MGILCCLPLVIMNKTSQQIQLNILDVGQGQAIFLQHSEQNWLIDTGGSYDEKIFSIGQNVVVPFLRQQGVRQLDHVVLSHLDQDHSGAFPLIQQEIPVKQLISNEQLPNDLKQPFQYCHQGQQWHYPELDIQILWPKEKIWLLLLLTRINILVLYIFNLKSWWLPKFSYYGRCRMGSRIRVIKRLS